MIPLHIGPAKIELSLEQNVLRSLGHITIGGTSLRNRSTRFVPWIDSYEGQVFRQFRFLEVTSRGSTQIIRTRAISDPDSPFRERRDCSGDPCFRDVSWDAPPVEADLDICFNSVQTHIDGRDFHGFKYWFEYSGTTPIHRLLDRQTWELGGNLDDVTICLRNWLTPPRVKLSRESAYSTVGLDKWAGLLPGNLWGRWSLLPGFDMQYGKAGVLVGCFDAVSLIRTVIETSCDEDALRVQDLHYFTQSTRVATNPKSILYSSDRLSEIDAVNLWTRLNDREYDRARVQFNMKDEGAPAIVFSENQWKNFRLDTSYEKVVDIASEFGAEYVFIDPIWENGQALDEELAEKIPTDSRYSMTLAKTQSTNMCTTFDFEVASIFGGESGLKKFVDRSRKKGVKILSWFSTHYHPFTKIQEDASLHHGQGGIFAMKESGRHPDTGYVSHCWPVNLNGAAYEKIRQQIFGVCQRTGLAGFLWDSYCNLGWWQIDYSKGDMQPQFDKMASLYAQMVNAELYIMPEAIVTFSRHSCCGLHGGNVYAGDALAFSYNTHIALTYHDPALEQGKTIDWANRVLTGEAPFELLFRSMAHGRVPGFNFHNVPREKWDVTRVTMIKNLFAQYKASRPIMQKRTVLENDAGVLWENENGQCVLFSFRENMFHEQSHEAWSIKHFTGKHQPLLTK